MIVCFLILKNYSEPRSHFNLQNDIMKAGYRSQVHPKLYSQLFHSLNDLAEVLQRSL